MAGAWLPIRPGSEAILALAIGHVLVAEKLYDRRSIRSAADFAGEDGCSYEGLLQKYAPEAVETATGVSAAAIGDTARRLARERPSIAIGGADPGGGPLPPEAETAI